MKYGRYNKQYEFGPNLSRKELNTIAAHEGALQTILMGNLPWLDVYQGELKREMAGEFLASLMLPEMTEQEVADSYVGGTYDVDTLLDHVLAEAREQREQERRLGSYAAHGAVRLAATVRLHEQTGYLETIVAHTLAGRSFG